MPKNKKASPKKTVKKGIKHHYHLIINKLTPVRVFVLVVLLLLPITVAVILITDFQPQKSFAGNKNTPGQEIKAIRKPDNQIVEQFSLTETSFINDFTLKINDFKIVTTESQKYDNYCILSLEMFNFGNETLLAADQFKLTQGDKNLPIWDKVLPSNPLKMNYSVNLEKAKPTTFDIYFACDELSAENLNFSFTPFRLDNIQSQRANFPVFDSQKNQYYGPINYGIILNDSFKIVATKELPIQIQPIKFELTTINSISLCILRLELTNNSYSPWLFDEADLVLSTDSGQKLNRLVVETSSGGVFRKIPLNPSQTEAADYAFNCSTKGNYKLKYTPNYITSDFVEEKESDLNLSL